MTPPQHNELTWTDRPFAELIRLAWPIAVSTLSYAAMTLADTLFVGQLGPEALAGVGLGGTMAFTLLVFAIGLLRGVKILVSQAAGAGRAGESRAYLGAGLLIALASGAVVVALGQLVAPLAEAISASAAAGAHASTYLRIRLLGTPMLLAFVALRENRYGLGDARSPMIASLAGNAVNIALDYVLVLHVGAGVAGAAWATVVGHVTEVGIIAWAQRPDGYGVRACAWRHIAAVVRVGWPTGVQFALEVGSFMLLAGMLAALSETDMAAHQIALQVVHVSFLPAFAVGEAASVLIGQAVGANRDRLVIPVARLGLAVATTYTALGTVVILAAAPLIASAFTSDPGLADAAVHLLYVAAIFQVFDGGNVVARGALRGTGDVRIPAVIGIATAWALTPPFTWLLGYRAGLGALGGWIGLCCEIIIGALILWHRLVRGGWKAAALRSREQIADDFGGCSDNEGTPRLEPSV